MFEKPIRILFPSQASVDGQHMQIHFASDTDIELVVEQTLPDCCNVIQVRISPPHFYYLTIGYKKKDILIALWYFH